MNKRRIVSVAVVVSIVITLLAIFFVFFSKSNKVPTKGVFVERRQTELYI